MWKTDRKAGRYSITHTHTFCFLNTGILGIWQKHNGVGSTEETTPEFQSL